MDNNSNHFLNSKQNRLLKTFKRTTLAASWTQLNLKLVIVYFDAQLHKRHYCLMK